MFNFIHRLTCKCHRLPPPRVVIAEPITEIEAARESFLMYVHLVSQSHVPPSKLSSVPTPGPKDVTIG
ncbi:hypothetical protein LCGC14_1321060 [marine sediment metagenome]|uniref:Uncharacterized protein n=1 Tax=marine sediment metagenome TaxID=412755 RepID=A0A0F9N0C0_9ZZZZ